MSSCKVHVFLLCRALFTLKARQIMKFSCPSLNCSFSCDQAHTAAAGVGIEAAACLPVCSPACLLPCRLLKLCQSLVVWLHTLYTAYLADLQEMLTVSLVLIACSQDTWLYRLLRLFL